MQKASEQEIYLVDTLDLDDDLKNVCASVFQENLIALRLLSIELEQYFNSKFRLTMSPRRIDGRYSAVVEVLSLSCELTKSVEKIIDKYKSGWYRDNGYFVCLTVDIFVKKYTAYGDY